MAFLRNFGVNPDAWKSSGRSLLWIALGSLLVRCSDGAGPTPRVVSRVEITPANPVVHYPTIVPLTAVARDAADSVIPGKTFTWLIDDSLIATVGPLGTLVGQGRGSTIVRARADSVEGSTNVTVTMPATSITIFPAADTVVAYDTTTFTAIATDKNGDTVPAPLIVWSSSNDSLATIDSQGVVITLEPGMVTLLAATDNVVRSATLLISPPRVASVRIAAPNSGTPTTEVPLRATEPFIALTFDGKDRVLLGRGVTWQSSDSSIVSVSDSGLVAALAGGAVNITATSEGIVSPQVGVSVLILPPLTFLAVGDFRSCATATDSTVYCWGANGSGELGDGTTIFRDGPVLVQGGHAWVALTIGDFHSCGLTESGAAFCWGRNEQGQLGTGTTTESHVPIAVIGGHVFKSIAAGSAYTCGVTTTHEAYCWGSNGHGQLGTGDKVPSLTPTLVQGALSFEAISTSRIDLSTSVVTCGTTTTGAGYCWGTNDDGQLGTGDSTGALVPRRISGTQQWTEISASTVHSCGRDSAGAAFCWGANPYGAFGNGTTASDPFPTPVDSGPYLTISAGYLFGCAVRSSGDLMCFGDNTSYQLGIDGPPQLESPTNPAPGLQFAVARAGRSHACALTTTGQVYCWGSSIGGEAGADTKTSVRTPFRVVGQP